MKTDFVNELKQNVQSFYEAHGAAFSRTRGGHWNEQRAAAALVKAGMTVVDVGAGNGRFAKLLPENATYIGIEPSASLRKDGPQNIDLRDGSLPKLDLTNEIADITVCFAVFHHIPTAQARETAVTELIRITKPNGYIIATSWTQPSHAKKIENGEPGDLWVPWKAEGADAKRYVHAMQPGEWEALWERRELNIERIGLFGRSNWTEDQKEARNWMVIARKK